MKVLTNHLSKIIIKHHILWGNNFTKISEDSIKLPIKLMNMIIEDARINKKLLWILLQDLSKVYNHVSLLILCVLYNISNYLLLLSVLYKIFYSLKEYSFYYKRLIWLLWYIDWNWLRRSYFFFIMMYIF